jgi:tyrosyl-tRNA synthetase
VTHILDELAWRGLVAQTTDADALRAALSDGQVTLYCGFDPTAPSLHIGNLVQILTVRRLQDAGHRPLALVGGATGLIGDPKMTGERTLNSPEIVAGWVERIRRQIEPLLRFDGPAAATMVNNLDWTAPLSAIDFLRDVGKHYRVGTMLKKDAVASRLNSDAGISYTEFSYQILQGFDYLELYRQYGCVLQTGGSDQWGNLTSGTDLIHRVEGASVHAIGTPLVTNSDGTKFGKSEGNAIWLDASMCSPYAFYQFWLNTDDADVISRLKIFTFLSRERIEELEALVATEPFKREAQKVLATEVTTLVHGADATQAVIDASRALFGQGDLAALDRTTLEAALRELPNTTASTDASIVQLLVDTGLVSSQSEGRRAIAQGGVSLDNVRIDDDAATLDGRVAAGGLAVLRRGKKTLAGIFVE